MKPSVREWARDNRAGHLTKMALLPLSGSLENEILSLKELAAWLCDSRSTIPFAPF